MGTYWGKDWPAGEAPAELCHWFSRQPPSHQQQVGPQRAPWCPTPVRTLLPCAQGLRRRVQPASLWQPMRLNRPPVCAGYSGILPREDTSVLATFCLGCLRFYWWWKCFIRAGHTLCVGGRHTWGRAHASQTLSQDRDGGALGKAAGQQSGLPARAAAGAAGGQSLDLEESCGRVGEGVRP